MTPLEHWNCFRSFCSAAVLGCGLGPRLCTRSCYQSRFTFSEAALTAARVGLAAMLIAVNLSTSLGQTAAEDLLSPRQIAQTRNPLTVFAPNRKLSAVLSTNGIIQVRSADGALLRKFHHCSPIAAVFSADGTLLCSAGRPQHGVTSFKVWRLADCKLISTFKTNTEDLPLMVFSAKNDFLASTSGRTRVALWEIPQGKLRWTAPLNRPVASLSFDDDNTIRAKYANNRVKRLPVVGKEAFLTDHSFGNWIEPERLTNKKSKPFTRA